jgi:hypothetical protein
MNLFSEQGTYSRSLEHAPILEAVAVEVSERFGVVGDHGVKIESLGIGEIGVGYKLAAFSRRRPVRNALEEARLKYYAEIGRLAGRGE